MGSSVPGIVLAVTGVIALIVSLTRGPNLGISPRAGAAIGVTLLVIGTLFLLHTATGR